jgi:hypothetical protein
MSSPKRQHTLLIGRRISACACACAILVSGTVRMRWCAVAYTKLTRCQRLSWPEGILWMACYDVLIRRASIGAFVSDGYYLTNHFQAVYTNSLLGALNMRPYFRGDTAHLTPAPLMLSPRFLRSSASARPYVRNDIIKSAPATQWEMVTPNFRATRVCGFYFMRHEHPLTHVDSISLCTLASLSKQRWMIASVWRLSKCDVAQTCGYSGDRISTKVPQTYVPCTSFICIRYHNVITQVMPHVIYHGWDTIGIYLSADLPASWLSCII